MAELGRLSKRLDEGVNVLPVLFVYPFVRKYFTKGVIFGAAKG